MIRAELWLGLTAGLLLAPHAVRAQEAPRNLSILRRSVPAPVHALELTISAGYNQGVGAFGTAPALHVQDVAGVGAGADLGIGYRISPRIAFGGYGSGALYSSPLPDGNASSFAFGAEGDWHFRPYRSIDPWMSIGAGYRVFSSSTMTEGTRSRRAFQALRVALGVDYRFSPEVAIGPYLSADMSIFFRESRPGVPDIPAGVGFASFVSGGIAVRFDVIGHAEHPAIEMASR
jgi:hypothetical protein